MPHYEIEFTLSDDLSSLQGTANIRVPNNSADPWTYLIFRLYPALPQYGAEFSIQNAAVEGRTAPFTYLEQNTAVARGVAACAAAGADDDRLPELAAGDPALGRGHECGLPSVRLQPGLCEPAALLSLAGGLPAGADRGDRALVAGEGHQPRGCRVQLYLPIRRHRHGAERSDRGDERDADHLDNGQRGAGAAPVGDGQVARVFHPSQRPVSVGQPGGLRHARDELLAAGA